MTTQLVVVIPMPATLAARKRKPAGTGQRASRDGFVFTRHRGWTAALAQLLRPPFPARGGPRPPS
jgi:hypothetical protein